MFICYSYSMWLTNGYSHNYVSTKVVGGIGNQLFCYFAGLSLARRLNYNFVIDISDIRNGKSAHSGSIEELFLPGNFIATSGNPTINFVKRLFAYILKRFPNKFQSKHTYYSNVIGYDPQLENVKSHIKLNGYFQTYRYFQEVSSEILPLKLKTRSEWFISTLEELNKSDFISLHIRRGDYLNLSDAYGLLGTNYYKRAIEILNKKSISGRLVVFSDDIMEAKRILNGVADENTYWVDPPSTSSPVESLILMSHASSNIIANSTYSWWGAAINSKKHLVIAPAKWFKSMEDPQELYPPQWILIDSSWES